MRFKQLSATARVSGSVGSFKKGRSERNRFLLMVTDLFSWAPPPSEAFDELGEIMVDGDVMCLNSCIRLPRSRTSRAHEQPAKNRVQCD